MNKLKTLKLNRISNLEKKLIDQDLTEIDSGSILSTLVKEITEDFLAKN